MGDQYESIGPAQGDGGGAPPPPPPPAAVPAGDAAPDNNNNSGYKSAAENFPKPEPIDDKNKPPAADANPDEMLKQPAVLDDKSKQTMTDLQSGTTPDAGGALPPEAVGGDPNKMSAPTPSPNKRKPAIAVVGGAQPYGPNHCVSLCCERACIIVSTSLLVFFAILLTIAIVVPYASKCFSYCPTYF